MKTDRTQKGQALILIVFAVIGLLALTGLAVDGSVTYSNRQGAQNAAETAALTGALDLANSVSSSTTIVNDRSTPQQPTALPMIAVLRLRLLLNPPARSSPDATAKRLHLPMLPNMCR